MFQGKRGPHLSPCEANSWSQIRSSKGSKQARKACNQEAWKAWTRHGKCFLQNRPIKDFLGLFLILYLNSSLHVHLNFQSVPTLLEKPHLHFISLELGIEFHCNFWSYLAINSHTLSCNEIRLVRADVIVNSCFGSYLEFLGGK